MKTKEDIVKNWLPRYTGEKLSNFGSYILLTNFSNYVQMFAELHNVEVVGTDRPMQCATADGITIINFGMGSPGAATVMDLLSAIVPKAVLFLGKCGGLKKRNKNWRPYFANSRHTRRGYLQRLLSARGAGDAFVCLAESHFYYHPGSRCGLLDGHCLYHQPPRVGTR